MPSPPRERLAVPQIQACGADGMPPARTFRPRQGMRSGGRPFENVVSPRASSTSGKRLNGPSLEHKLVLEATIGPSSAWNAAFLPCAGRFEAPLDEPRPLRLVRYWAVQ